MSDSQRLSNSLSHQWLLWVALFFILCLCTAFSDYTTKGEPREAIVAMTMLSSDNWVLPIDASGDMAFKPPMFHWLVSLFSLPLGHVTEFTSRLPSILSLTILLILTAKFCGRRYSVTSEDAKMSSSFISTNRYGLLCASMALTCFEMIRAGTIARVDMVLTTFMVGAMMALFYSGQTKHIAAYLLIATLCMSGGVLTKGPIATILPVGAYWIWRMLKRGNFFKVTGLCLLISILSLILPLLWYYAAYTQGGERFLTLAMEENFGRFTGSMTYESHEHNLVYNFYSVLIGLLPWSAAILLSLIFKPVRSAIGKLRYWKTLWKQMTPEARFALIAALMVFIFYCIPKSKRSVYLLPMYPFMAYGLGWYAVRLIKHNILTRRVLRGLISVVFALYIIAVGIVMPVISYKDSDRIKARQIAEVVTASQPIYTFIPDRFARFYILDFYLDGRLVALFPSAQVSDKPNNEADILVPNEKTFYILTGENLIKDNSAMWDAWLNEHNLRATQVYKSAARCHDIKDNPVIFEVVKVGSIN